MSDITGHPPSGYQRKWVGFPVPEIEPCCDAAYHCRGLDPAKVLRSHVAMIILGKYGRSQNGNLVIGIGENFKVITIPEYQLANWIIAWATRFYPEMPELRRLDE